MFSVRSRAQQLHSENKNPVISSISSSVLTKRNWLHTHSSTRVYGNQSISVKMRMNNTFGLALAKLVDYK